MTLKDKTFSAIRWTTTAALTRALFQIAQLAVLARLLLPEDYGLMAVVGVVLTFAGLFADLGVNSAFVQRQQVTREQRSSLFWLNILTSAGLMMGVVAASPLCAWFFGDERLTSLIVLSAPIFVLGALGQQVRMSAEKNLDFRPVVVLEICAALMGFVVAVLAALAGWGVYSLVAAAIASTSVASALAWKFIARGWRPMWRLRTEDVRPFLGFGGALVALNIVGQIHLTLDLFLCGRTLTAAQLGLYSVSRNLSLQIQFVTNPVITRVGFPLIAQVQSDAMRVKSIYLKTINMTASTNAPLYVGMAFFASEIVAVMLGAGWERSVEPLRILALWGGVRSIGNPIGSLLLGMGRAGLALRWNLCLLLIVLPVLWLGSQGGPEGMAWALLGLQIVLFVPGWFVLVRPLCHAGLAEFSVSAFKPFLFAGLAVAPAFWVADQFDAAVIRLIVGVAIAAPLYLGISFKGNPEWIAAMMELVGNRKSSA